jgi:phosphatidylglycerophosphatase A
MKLRDNAVIFFATGCYVGKIPIVPGTFGSILGLLLCFVLSKIDLLIAIVSCVIFIIAAIWIAKNAERILNKRDPGCIVIDEISGMAVTLLGLPFNWVTVVFGFILFRLFDIIKPFPIRNLEQRLSGGTGVVLDDVAAGCLANIALRLAFFLKDIA